MTIDYIPIGVVNRNDNNPDSYLVNGVATEIIKDNSGLVANGTIFNPSTIGYMDEKIDETVTEVNSLQDTISNFAATVRSTVLTGLSSVSGAVISATDTVLSALGKLQKQITTNKGTADTHIIDLNNPHDVNKADVGLSLVDNISLQTHQDDLANPHSVNKTDVGLSLVDNINITSGTANPTGGSNGDIYFQYE